MGLIIFRVPPQGYQHFSYDLYTSWFNFPNLPNFRDFVGWILWMRGVSARLWISVPWQRARMRCWGRIWNTVLAKNSKQVVGWLVGLGLCLFIFLLVISIWKSTGCTSRQIKGTVCNKALSNRTAIVEGQNGVRLGDDNKLIQIAVIPDTILSKTYQLLNCQNFLSRT